MGYKLMFKFRIHQLLLLMMLRCTLGRLHIPPGGLRRYYAAPVIKEWFESEIITDRKSRFQARHTPLTDPDEIPIILEQFMSEHKNIAKSASHPHMIAWRCGTIEQKQEEITPTKGKKKNKPSVITTTSYSNVQQGFKDNGEKGAGSRILEQVLVPNNIMNVLVIATRWYNGNPIGSLRFRHIVNTSFDSLRKANRL